MFQIKHYETLETFNNEKSNLETPWVAYVEENSTVYYSVDDITKYRILCIRQKDISNITYEAVDLGLPSGLKWADRNVGASSPEDFGSYFQWGDTNAYTYDGVGEITVEQLVQLLQVLVGNEIEVTTDNAHNILTMLFDGVDPGYDISIFGFGTSIDKVFSWDTYFDTYNGGVDFDKYNNGGLTVLELKDDAAHVNMSSAWRMPTNEETHELIYNTTHTFIDLHGNEYSEEQAQNGAILENNLKGIKFIGFNGNSIFIPAAGNCHGLTLNSVGRYGNLWSSSLLEEYSDFGTTLYFYYNGYVADGNDQRYLGLSVRGVLKQ